MGTWNWKQPSGKILKVISNHDKGTIYVFDENNKLVLVKKGLPKHIIELIEKNFLAIVANNDNNKNIDHLNPMYV